MASLFRRHHAHDGDKDKAKDKHDKGKDKDDAHAPAPAPAAVSPSKARKSTGNAKVHVIVDSRKHHLPPPGDVLHFVPRAPPPAAPPARAPSPPPVSSAGMTNPISAPAQARTYSLAPQMGSPISPFSSDRFPAGAQTQSQTQNVKQGTVETRRPTLGQADGWPVRPDANGSRHAEVDPFSRDYAFEPPISPPAPAPVQAQAQAQVQVHVPTPPTAQPPNIPSVPTAPSIPDISGPIWISPKPDPMPNPNIPSGSSVTLPDVPNLDVEIDTPSMPSVPSVPAPDIEVPSVPIAGITIPSGLGRSVAPSASLSRGGRFNYGFSPEEALLQEIYRSSRQNEEEERGAISPVPEGSTSPRLRSDSGSPTTERSPKMGGRARRSPRTRHGSSGARMETAEETKERRRLRAERAAERERRRELREQGVEEDDEGREEAAGGRGAEDNQERLQRETSQMYPGVDLRGRSAGPGTGLGFAGSMGFDESMDDILDPSASRADGRHGSTSGPAQPNIAPWLMEDTSAAAPAGAEIVASPSHSGSTTPSGGRRQSQALSHFSSVPALPKIRRAGDIGDIPENGGGGGYGTSGLASRTSQGDILAVPSTSANPSSSESSTRDSSRSRHGSGDSLQTLSAFQQRRKASPQDNVAPLPGVGRQASIAGGRLSRFGSTASNATSGSAGSEKKKGLFGLLKRKNTAASAFGGLPTDFNPEVHRDSTGGSTSSKLSGSASMGSLSNKRSHPSMIEMPEEPYRVSSRNQSFASEPGMISPMDELSEGDIHLDMNLDDMEGIVDTSIANAPPAPAGAPQRLPTLPPGQSGTTDSTAVSSLGLQDVATTSSFATTISGVGSSGSDASVPGAVQTPGRSVLGEADRQGPFNRPNPFSNSPTNSIDGKPRTPPSPLTMSPKHNLPASTQPRRPSQLRNVKMGSMDSDMSGDGPDSALLQPLAPAWIAGAPTGATVFNDPFGSASRPGMGDAVSVAGAPTTTGSAHGTPHAPQEAAMQGAAGAAGAAAALANAAAWAAPESWGVEGDEDVDESSSSSEDGAWTGDEAHADGKSPTLYSSPPGTGAGKKPLPFGAKSMGAVGAKRGGKPGSAARGGRAKTAAGRPLTAVKGGALARPGTAGSLQVNTVPHWIRIYRVDGSYAVLAFPLMATTVDVINVLSGAADAAPGKKVTTSMKLYLRERGQDRQLLPSEKPLLIQDRRLRQAGFTEAEKLEEIGKDDLALLCRFIYQTPPLPIMDPDEESTYDSFEFIDIGGRDLQTIPIFLHLHASNIVILNISRNPMTDIPLDFIQACTSLKELRMTNMALKRVPASIRTSTTLARIDLSSNRINDLESVQFNEIATLTSLKVQNNKLTSVPAYFAQMQALKYLNISNNKFETFPAVVCEMSNLVDLDVSFNNIAELPSEMSNLKSLERLAVFGNELTKFPDSFCTLANLRDLDVRRNNLTDLSSVYALPHLTRLQADHNDIVTLDAQLGAKVRTFSVPFNSITRFTLAPLLNMAAVTYSLTHLNLSHGKISNLADEALSGLVNLVDLNLNFNQFTRLPPTLDRLTNLEVLSCTENALNSLPVGLGRMQKLRILNVHNNNLKELPADIWGCSSLESMNVSSNLLNDLPEPPADLASMIGPDASAEAARKMSIASAVGDKFAAMPVPPAGRSLAKLYLGDNRLTDEVFHAIAQMPNLQILNLSFNDIYEIPSNTLSNNLLLEGLYLSGNKLTSLPSEDLEKLQRLRVLHLNGNKLQTLPSELGAIKSLQHLDVGSNVLKYNIANWPYDWNWNWNTGLRYLNLSGNKRLEIKPTSAQDMSHASSFRKELSDFTALTQLRILGLMDVTLRIPSLPDESDEKRVRTSFSEINHMAYGISDNLGSQEHLAMFDLVVPEFRGKENECLFGIFGRPAPSIPSGRIPKFLQESFAANLAGQLERLEESESPDQALRRTFLMSNRKTFEFLVGSAKDRKRSAASFQSIDSMFKNWSPSPGSVFRTGSSGAVVYVVDKTLYIGNVGSALVLLSRKGEVELLAKIHDPTEREETARIRRAEAWVSTKGFINDDKDLDISRAFGFWHHFPSVNASPEIRVHEMQESDEFVIIGNRALWSVCSYQTAVDIARTERDDPMMAAQKLRDFAISYGAEGSLMIMVVNISDLFHGRGRRPKTGTGAGPQAPLGDADGEAGWATAAKRNVRRRYEEVGDRTLNRLQQEIEPPQGQVAIVFTDIVNSTHLWETNPGMGTSIKIHHSLMRRQLRLDGGYEVKTEGDSFMVSFQTVTSAILWAFNCQILLLQQEWPLELLEAQDGKVVYDSEGNIIQRGLRVRMGVHWGSPQCERDPITRRMDYYGPMVNRSARINASADGGQLMASLDVINELHAVREYLESLDEEGIKDMPAELKRHAMELRRIGLEVKEMGERKLKGLEVPEKLHLLYPKLLSGRFEDPPHLAANVEVNDVRTFPQERLVNIDEVRELAALTLRLEALSALQPSQAYQSPPGTPRMLQPSGSGHGAGHVNGHAAPHGTGHLTPHGIGTGHMTPHGNGHATIHGTGHANRLDMEQVPGSGAVTPMRRHRTKVQPPAFLGPSIKDDMTDEELGAVLESLTTRIENALSSMYIKQLGGFSEVLAALEQATRIDQRMLVHAMALMNGMM